MQSENKCSYITYSIQITDGVMEWKNMQIEIGMEQEYESISIVNTRFVKEKLFKKCKLAWHKRIESKCKLHT